MTVSGFHSIKRGIALILLVLLASVPVPVSAAESKCPEHFAGGVAPDLIRQDLNYLAREVCYSGYAVLHSGSTRTPIYTAEHLTRERLLQARGVKRSNRFHPDDNIPYPERAELSDYARSGYDRGHMAPAADMPDGQSMYESFSLANMVPQNPTHNRGAWARVEADVRTMALERGQLYVITGPIFADEDQEKLKGGVRVPGKLFKVLLDQQGNVIKAIQADNSATGESRDISLAVLEGRTGLLFSQ
ncbi:MAG: DNA/RNA non-specific endonuclease [Desulfuromonadales bacterium]